jgi:hypothetical protein
VDVGQSARCVTVGDASAVQEYESYVNRSEKAMPARFVKGELAWIPDGARAGAIGELNAGRQVRWNISDAGVNQHAADRNATVIDWIGAVRMRGARIPDLLAVLQDYARYPSLYGPLIYDCHSRAITGTVAGAVPAAYDVTFGLQNTYRAAALFPQHYAFQVKARTDYSGDNQASGAMLLVHQRSSEIRESDSGVPGRADLLEPYRDHGILWGLNTYWRARQSGPDLYVEFEAITLARSIQDFRCKIGLFPVPKLLVSGAVDSIPSESLEIMLSATQTACERLASHQAGGASRH